MQMCAIMMSGSKNRLPNVYKRLLEGLSIGNYPLDPHFESKYNEVCMYRAEYTINLVCVSDGP
jgi:hypothetical protein